MSHGEKVAVVRGEGIRGEQGVAGPPPRVAGGWPKAAHATHEPRDSETSSPLQTALQHGPEGPPSREHLIVDARVLRAASMCQYQGTDPPLNNHESHYYKHFKCAQVKSRHGLFRTNLEGRGKPGTHRRTHPV